MTIPQVYRRLANRHAAKLLSQLCEIHDLSELAQTAIKKEFHYLAEDIFTAKKKENQNEESYNR